MRDAIFEHDKDGKVTENYKAAMDRFMKTNVCRLESVPDILLASLENTLAAVLIRTVIG